MELDKVKQTILDMLRLAGDSGATEGEVDNALSFVSKMMAKYQLDPEDIEQKDIIIDELANAEFCQHEVRLGGKKYSLWESSAAYFIADMVGGVKFYRRTSKKDMNGDLWFRGEIDTFVFYGVKADVDLACEMFTELMFIIQSMGRIRFGGAYKGSGRSYCEGFASGLRGKLALENKKQVSASGNALIVIARDQIIERKKNLAEEFLQKNGINLDAGAARNNNIKDKAAYHSGYKDGQNHIVVKAKTKIK